MEEKEKMKYWRTELVERMARDAADEIAHYKKRTRRLEAAVIGLSAALLIALLCILELL